MAKDTLATGTPENPAREMRDEDRKSIVVKYLQAFDNGGVAPSGEHILDLFADTGIVFFPKWGLAVGKKQIRKLFADVGGQLVSITHHYDTLNWHLNNSDMLVVEGSSHGEHKDGTWRAGSPAWAAGNWCDVFEIRDWKIQRCFIYLDPDYAGRDTLRYPWIKKGR